MTMDTNCTKHKLPVGNGELGGLRLPEQLLHSDEGSCSASSGDDVKRAASSQDGDDEAWCLDGVDLRRHLQVSVGGGTGGVDDVTSTGDVCIVTDDTSCPPSSSLPDYGHPHPAMTSPDAKEGSASQSSDPSGGGHCNSEYCFPQQSSSEFAYLRPPSDHFSSPPFVVSTSFADHEVYWHYNPGPDIYSRKAFVGGLTANLGQDELYATFRRFGPLYIDLPRKQDAKNSPKGYAFLVFENESSIQSLVRSCYVLDNNFYITVSGSNMVQHQVQVKAWRLADANFVVDASMPLDPRKTIFVGGVPRPLKAVELAHLMERVFGSVCYVGIDTDPDLQYPKGAARVSFSTQQSFFTAITTQFIRLNQLQHNKSEDEELLKRRNRIEGSDLDRDRSSGSSPVMGDRRQFGRKVQFEKEATVIPTGSLNKWQPHRIGPVQTGQSRPLSESHKEQGRFGRPHVPPSRFGTGWQSRPNRPQFQQGYQPSNQSQNLGAPMTRPQQPNYGNQRVNLIDENLRQEPQNKFESAGPILCGEAELARRRNDPRETEVKVIDNSAVVQRLSVVQESEDDLAVDLGPQVTSVRWHGQVQNIEVDLNSERKDDYCQVSNVVKKQMAKVKRRERKKSNQKEKSNSISEANKNRLGGICDGEFTVSVENYFGILASCETDSKNESEMAVFKTEVSGQSEQHACREQRMYGQSEHPSDKFFETEASGQSEQHACREQRMSGQSEPPSDKFFGARAYGQSEPRHRAYGQSEQPLENSFAFECSPGCNIGAQRGFSCVFSR